MRQQFQLSFQEKTVDLVTGQNETVVFRSHDIDSLPPIPPLGTDIYFGEVESPGSIDGKLEAQVTEHQFYFRQKQILVIITVEKR